MSVKNLLKITIILVRLEKRFKNFVLFIIKKRWNIIIQVASIKFFNDSQNQCEYEMVRKKMLLPNKQIHLF